MNIEQNIIAHYTGTPDLGLRLITLAGGAEGITAEKLAPYDEMHTGGHKATLHLLGAMGLQAGMRVLDMGCGVGGAARMAAWRHGVEVTGIDLTPDYCMVATMLSELTGQGDVVSFETGNATATKFDDAVFDAAYTIHVAMNIENKAALYAEAFRILKPGARFGIYDIMRGDAAAEPQYPLPWASMAETSFLTTPAAVMRLLEGAGFVVELSESRHEFARAALAKMVENMDKIRVALPISDFAARIANLHEAIESGAVTAHQFVVRKSDI